LVQRSKEGGPFPLNKRQLETLQKLKKALENSRVLSIYSPNREKDLHTDASSYGYGSVLMQNQDDGKIHPVSYYSGKTSEVESRYHSFELETFTVIYATRRFIVYLEHRPLEIVNDCNSLVQMLNRKSISQKIARWTIELADFDYSIIHRPGSNMARVDVLSTQSQIMNKTILT